MTHHAGVPRPMIVSCLTLLAWIFSSEHVRAGIVASRGEYFPRQRWNWLGCTRSIAISQNSTGAMYPSFVKLMQARL